MSLIGIIFYRIVQLISLLVIVHTLLSYFLPPYHPAREFLGRIVEPMLAPIRRMLPQTGMLDFSPLVLIIALQIVSWIVLSIF